MKRPALKVVEPPVDRPVPDRPVPDRIMPSRVSRIAVWTIVAMFAALMLWATLAEVDETATASGRVIPSRQLQVVSNLEGGVIAAILVRHGDRVIAGQPLVTLDGTQFTGDLGKMSDTYNALLARTARLQAEERGSPLDFPPALVAAAPQLVAAEAALYRARAAGLAAASNVEAAKIAEAQHGVGQAAAESSARASAAALADRQVAMIGPLVAKGIEPQLELVRALSAQASANGEARSAVFGVRRAEATVGEARASLGVVRNRFRSDSIEQLTQGRAELANQGDALPALGDRLRRASIRAPVGGIVNRVLVTTIGGSVRPGEPLVEIVPVNDNLVIEAEARPSDIAFMHVGQRAMVKFTAYDYYVYGGLIGQIEAISPDAIVNERTGETHFVIHVRTLRSALRARDGSTLPIGAGMTAQIDVLGHKRSVLSYLLTPFSRLRDNAFREK